MAFLILRDMMKKNRGSEMSKERISKQGVLAAQAVRSMLEALKSSSHWLVSHWTLSVLDMSRHQERTERNKQLQAFAALNGLKMLSTESFDDTKSGDEK